MVYFLSLFYRLTGSAEGARADVPRNPVHPDIRIIQYEAGEGASEKRHRTFSLHREHIVALLCKAWPWHLNVSSRLPGDHRASSLTPLSMLQI
jgi:hypothetical protein